MERKSLKKLVDMMNSTIPNNPAKETEGKPDYTLVPTTIIKEIEKVRKFGVEKYKERDSWRAVNREEYVKAVYRHFLDVIDGKIYDDESGLKSWSHIACNIAFILEMDET